jgi:formamidopyrimidine-DNA glycosylase
MPELPEVQTIVNELHKEIAGKTVEGVDVRLPKMVQGEIQELIGQRVKAVERRAKLIVIRLSHGSLAIHLKMTGQLFFLAPHRDHTVTGEREGKFTHVVFRFSDGSRLLFNDMRQFGYVKVLPNEQLKTMLAEAYGIEPIDPAFTPEKLKEIVRNHASMRVKALLTNQAIIAGIGNIYVDEALWEAKIHPLTNAASLTNEEIGALHRGIKAVLSDAIRYLGTSMDTYRRTTGEKGEYERYRRVYRSDGKPCPRCGATIVRIAVGGRGTHFCPRCQVQKH